jgi:hypothetical protein
MLARIQVMHTTRGYLSRETWRVSIRAVPKNYLIYQGNPDDGPLLELLGGLITAGHGHEIDGLVYLRLLPRYCHRPLALTQICLLSMEWSTELLPFHHPLNLAITQGIARVPAHVPSDNLGFSH